MKKDKAILSFLSQTLWLIEQHIFNNLIDIVSRHAEGIKLTDAEIAKAILDDDSGSSPQKPKYNIIENTAVISISGIIAKHASEVNDISQPLGTSVEEITGNIDKALSDSRVQRIVLHIESPGGSAAGVPDLAKKIREAGKIKNIIAFADDIAASGAYWLGSQANKFYANRGGEVGSIGVFTAIRDSSEAAKNAGVKYIVVRTGQFKGVAYPGTKVKEEELEDIKNRINAMHGLFVSDVAAGRGVDLEKIKQISDGRMLSGQAAIDAGLIDGVTTLEEIISGKNSAVAKGNGFAPAAAGITEQIEPIGVTDMADKTLTAEEIEKNQKNAVDAAVSADRLRVQKVTNVLAGHPDLLKKAMEDSTCDETKATAMLVPALQATIKAKDEQLQAAQARLDAIAKAGNLAADTASSDALGKPPTEAKDDDSKTDDGKVETYIAAVKVHLAAGKKKGEAFKLAAKELPLSHDAWIAAKQPKIE